MKKYISILIVITALFGCDDASKIIEQTQEAANKAVDSIQEKMDSVDFDQLNLEQFDNGVEAAKEMTSSVKAALNANFSDPAAINEIKDHITNAYSCLVDASSESTAKKLMDKVMATINNNEAQTLIEKAIKKAKTTQECVMG